MSNELVFIIGLSIGALIGIVTISIFAATRITDLQSEVRDLRVQRKLLKEELIKPQSKPKPRNRRIASYKKKKRV